MTDKDKIKTLASWSSQYRAGITQMIEEGYDPEELDASIADAEEVIAEEREEHRKRAKVRRAVQNF